MTRTKPVKLFDEKMNFIEQLKEKARNNKKWRMVYYN